MMLKSPKQEVPRGWAYRRECLLLWMRPYLWFETVQKKQLGYPADPMRIGPPGARLASSPVPLPLDPEPLHSKIQQVGNRWLPPCERALLC